jgi:hypothetical protein
MNERAIQPMRRIDEITVGKRQRRDLGDIASLAKSIEANGLMHPIVIRPEIARGELAENVDRKDFAPFRKMVEELCPAPGYIDIFSRYRHSEKWTC